MSAAALDRAWTDSRAAVRCYASAELAKDESDLVGAGWIDLQADESYLRSGMVSPRMRERIRGLPDAGPVERRFERGRYRTKAADDVGWTEARRSGLRHLDDPAWPLHLLRAAQAGDVPVRRLGARDDGEAVLRVSRPAGDAFEWPDRGRRWLSRARPVRDVELRVWTDETGRLARVAYGWVQNGRRSWLEVRMEWAAASPSL